MRLIVARCQVTYTGRLATVLPEAVLMLMLKPDGTFMVWSDGGGPNVKPLNWMTPPTVLQEHHAQTGELRRLVVRKLRTEDQLQIDITQVLAEMNHQLDNSTTLEKQGLERELQELLAEQPHHCGAGLRLVRREWPTDIGPVDLMCKDLHEEWVAIEIKRIATIDAVEQLTRYLHRIKQDPALSSCRGILAAQEIKPQAKVLAQARDIACVEVNLDAIRTSRQPELTLFAA